MKKPIIPNNEKERLEDLGSYQLIGLQEQEEFDFLTSMASKICDTKISLITLITEDKQWFLSHHGIAARETPRDLAFCAHAINTHDKPFIVEDAREDERFYDNPLTTGEPHVIFYVGIPLISSAGFPLGTLCAIDNQPKNLSDKQIEELKKLAKICVSLFEKRKNEFENHALLLKLNEKNELLKETQDIHQIGNWELDIMTNQIIWSEMLYEIHEIPKNKKINKFVGIRLYQQHYQEQVSQAIENCISNGVSFDIECQILTKSIKQKWVRVTGRKVNQKLIGSFQDITNIKASANKQQLIIEGTNLGLWEWNIQTNEVFVNENWVEMLGYSMKELHPLSVATLDNLLHPDDNALLQEKLALCFSKAVELYDVELRLKHKAGHWIWVNDRGKVFEWTEDGKPLWMYGTHQEITERKKAEEESKRTTILLKAAQHIAKMGAWELDLATGKTFWTDEVYKIHEVTTDFDHNKANGIEFYHPDYRPVITKAITDSIEKQIPFDVKCKFITAKNNLRWVRSSGYPIINEGKVTYLIGMFRDITEEEEAKEAIIRKQSFSKQLLENMADGFSVVNTQGKQIGVNKALCQMTGFSEEELIGQTAPYPYWPEEELDNISKAFQQALLGEKNSFELTLKKKNEQRFPSLISSAILKDENENPINYFANVKDISDSKKAEAELVKTKDMLLQTGQVAKVGGWEFNTLSGEITWSDTTCDIHEVPHGFVPTYEQMASFYTPESWTRLQEAIQEALTKGTFFDLELKIITAKGKEIWVRSIGNSEFKNGKCVRLFGVLQDISIQKEAELMIVQSKEQYQSLVQNIPGITYRCKNDKDWTMLYISSQVDSITGYTAAALMGGAEVSYGMLIHPEDQEMVTQAVNAGIAANLPWAVEYRVRHKDGSIRWAYEKGTAVKNDKNEVLYLDGFILDITDRKKAENEIKALLKITEEQNNRLKNFAHIVSHNLRSHSSGICGLLDLIELESAQFYNNEYFTLLKHGSENLQQTIDDLTEIVKANLHNEALQEINVYSVITKNINSLASQISFAGIEIINEVYADVKVKGIPAYIDSIVLNMISNAIKYKHESRKSYLKIYSEEETSNIVLYFEDNGIGIDLNKFGSKIFGIYKTFHNHPDSRGVGLFITKNQVESIGGQITVNSEVNKGTTFKISFKK